jgi:hypothetical protein
MPQKPARALPTEGPLNVVNVLREVGPAAAVEEEEVVAIWVVVDISVETPVRLVVAVTAFVEVMIALVDVVTA